MRRICWDRFNPRKRSYHSLPLGNIAQDRGLAQIYPRKRSLDRAAFTAAVRKHELYVYHTDDEESIYLSLKDPDHGVEIDDASVRGVEKWYTAVAQQGVDGSPSAVVELASACSKGVDIFWHGANDTRIRPKQINTLKYAVVCVTMSGNIVNV